MSKLNKIVRAIFGVPWLVFGAQHFIYADFVANLVPAYFPARRFWAYLTGAAMIAAGASLIANVKSRLAAVLLGSMLLAFFLLIQIPKMAAGVFSAVNWTRQLQDFAIVAAAFMLAGLLSKAKGAPDAIKKLGDSSKYAFAALLIVFGIQQFFDPDFLTAKFPEYFPRRIFGVYLVGAWMAATGASVFLTGKARPAAIALGILLLVVNALRYLPLFLTGASNALLLTAAMLDLAIICGVFFLAGALPGDEQSPFSGDI